MQNKHFDIVLGLFVAVLLISNIASTKILDLGPFTFDGGTILFPLAYVFGDILTEVYGYRMSRRAVWTGFVALGLMSAVLAVVGTLPAAEDWIHQGAYDAILGVAPRIAVASLVAYFAGEFSNSFILAKIKIAMQGRLLWVRTIGSTIVGEGIDTLLFVTIAFAGTVPTGVLLAVITSNYVFKVGIEILATPLTYRAVRLLKRAVGRDVFDTNTNFNPFAVRRTDEREHS